MNTLRDEVGRTHTYLRLSVTDRCNLRCTYCMPAEGIALRPHHEILTFDEIERIVRIAAGLGVTKLRLTGGEPLVRRDLLILAGRLTAIAGIQHVGLTTNGVLLGENLHGLVRAGISSINISLDTLRRDRFRAITRRDEFDSVLSNIDLALRSAIPRIKINVVVMRGTNDDELPQFVDFARERRLMVRFIEYMPFKDNGWSAETMVPFEEMKSRIENLVELIPLPERNRHTSTKVFSIAGGTGTIGFITAMSDHFCGTCNRLRMSAKGELRSCLFLPSGVSVRDALRAGATDDVIADLLQRSLTGKPLHHFDTDVLKDFNTNSMVHVGG
jgi:GTP 3',8-cyclase